MPLASTTAAYTLINMASKFQEFFYGESGDVTFEYMNEDGEKLSTTVPNVAKVKADLEAHAVTDAELSDALTDYYSKSDLGDIKADILAKFNDYYKKSEVDGKVKTVDDKVKATNAVVASNKAQAASDLKTAKEVLHGEVLDADMTNVMSKAQFEANTAMNREKFAGSGFVKLFKSGYHRLNYINYGGMFTWNHDDQYFFQRRSDNHYPNIKPRGAYLYINNDGGLESNYFNINGVEIRLKTTDYPIQYSGIDLPDISVAPVIKDSANAPAMKQGDMAVLADFDRELTNGMGTFENDINGWYDGHAEWNEDEKALKLHNKNGGTYPNTFLNLDMFKGVTVRIKFEVGSVTSDGARLKVGLHRDGTWTGTVINTPDIEANKVYDLTLVPNATSSTLMIEMPSYDRNKDDYVNIKSISVTVEKSTPFVALQNTDAGDIYEQASKFESRDSVSRQDLVFLESWREDVTDKNVCYPYGNVQYRGGNVDGVSGIKNGTFPGADTYSLFGNWQEPGELIGKGYVWSELSLADKIKLASNPENNIYRDGEKWIQVRYKIVVEKGLGNIDADTVLKDAGFVHNGFGLWE